MEERKAGSAWGWARRNVTLRDALTVLLILVLFMNAYESRQANVHTAENNRILKSRDFNRLYLEHEQHHREHVEILKQCAGR